MKVKKCPKNELPTNEVFEISFILDYEVEGHSKEIMNKNLKRELKQIYEDNKIK